MKENEDTKTLDPLPDTEVGLESLNTNMYGDQETQAAKSESVNNSVAMANRVELDENLTIREASEALAKLRAAADLGTFITLDVSSLNRVDGAGVQLLCAVVKETDNQQLDLIWSGESNALKSAASQLGVTEFLRLIV